MCNISCNSGLFPGEKRSENALGHYAVSLSGHDAGKIYLVVGRRAGEGGAEYLLLADGRKRPFDRPKAKKPKHVAVLKEKDDDVAALLFEGRRVDDSRIIHSLKTAVRGRNRE